MALQTKMGQAAESFGLEDKMTKGLGREYIDTVLQAAFTRIANQGISSREQFGASSHARGMQFSGASEVKAPASITAEMAGGAQAAEGQIYEQNEQFKMNMQGQWLNVLKHEDQMEISRRQIEAQEGDLLDVITRVGAIVAAL